MILRWLFMHLSVLLWPWKFAAGLKAADARGSISALRQTRLELPGPEELEEQLDEPEDQIDWVTRSFGRDDEEPVGRLLLFLVVGFRPEVMRGVKNNIRRLRMTWGPMDVYMVHYDGKRSAWMEEASSWYARNVRFTEELPGIKFVLAKQLLPKLIVETAYEWVWLMDEDILLDDLDGKVLLSDARASGSVIVQPSLKSPPVPTPATSPAEAMAKEFSGCQPGEGMCDLLAPSSTCRLRHTNFVEVMAPLIQPRVLIQLFVNCASCIHDQSVWGLDMIWCSWVERALALPNQTACAVLDQVTMIHSNLKTLGKYTASGAFNFSEIHEKHFKAKRDVKEQHPTDWAGDQDGNLRTLACMPLNSTAGL